MVQNKIEKKNHEQELKASHYDVGVDLLRCATHAWLYATVR